jgi:hypothetical protein
LAEADHSFAATITIPPVIVIKSMPACPQGNYLTPESGYGYILKLSFLKSTK